MEFCTRKENIVTKLVPILTHAGPGKQCNVVAIPRLIITINFCWQNFAHFLVWYSYIQGKSTILDGDLKDADELKTRLGPK